MAKSSAPRRFRLLHWFYFRGAAVQFWLSRRIRPAGIGALLVVSLASFMCVGQPKNSIFQIFCFSFGLTFVSLLWATLRRAKVSAEIRIPKHSTVGESLSYSVLLTHEHSNELRSLKLLQTPPDPRPSLEEFTDTEEPGERERNVFDRKMIYYRWRWLMWRSRGFSSCESEATFDLPSGKKTSVQMKLTPAQRGVYILENLRLLMPDPLGFFQKAKSMKISPTRLIVLPKRYRLPQIEMPGSATFKIGGEETSNAIGNSGEFVGLREYRVGDSMRQIHWKSWAHTGKPMVKELEDTFYPRYALILDTFVGSTDRQVFEEMISIASSFIVGLDRSEVLIDLMFIAEKAHTVTAGRDIERPEKLLEVLAAVQVEQQPKFEALSASVIRHRDQITSSLVILNGWDEARAEFLKRLRETGILCVPIIIGKGASPEQIPGYWINSEDVGRDLLRLPNQLSPAI